jgi:hypothetical protein
MNHRQAWDLIPWYVNGTLEAGQEPLQRHLAQCAACRAEFEAQRTLHAAMQTRSQVENMPHQSLQKLMARIDAEPMAPPVAAVARMRTQQQQGLLRIVLGRQRGERVDAIR